MIDGLRNIAPYVVIDCGSYIANDILSAVALMESDAVLRLANADLKSISYLSSQLPLLKDAGWDLDKQYKTASNVKPQQAGDHMAKALGTVAFTLPYSDAYAPTKTICQSGCLSLGRKNSSELRTSSS